MADVENALRRTAARYRGCARFTRHYVASKLKRDPINRVILRLAQDAHFGQLLDVGCGRGQMSIALLEAGLASSVIGLDWAGRSLKDMERASSGLPVTIFDRDLASDASVPLGDTVLIIDVLYTMERQAALHLLEAAAYAAGRRIIVRSLDTTAGWRGKFSLFMEHLVRPFWPHSGATVDPLPLASIVGVLEDSGLAVHTEPCWVGTPFANVMIVGERT